MARQPEDVVEILSGPSAISFSAWAPRGLAAELFGKVVKDLQAQFERAKERMTTETEKDSNSRETLESQRRVAILGSRLAFYRKLPAKLGA